MGSSVLPRPHSLLSFHSTLLNAARLISEMGKISVGLLLVAWLSCAHCHTYYLGSCPTVEPMAGFDMDKFLGRWYVVQKFSTASTCWTYDFIKENGTLKIVQSRDHVLFDTVGFDNNYRYTGTLDIPDNNRQAFMRVRFPMSIAGKADYIAFATDYENYGAIFSCQSVLFGHRRSASILSRTKTLSQMYINKVRSKLESFGVDSHDFSIISQNDCQVLDSSSPLNVEVGPNTFSADNILNTVKNTGTAIANGVSSVAEGVGNLYNGLTDRKQDAESSSRPKTN